jgi:hypothetical protein
MWPMCGQNKFIQYHYRRHGKEVKERCLLQHNEFMRCTSLDIILVKRGQQRAVRTNAIYKPPIELRKS